MLHNRSMTLADTQAIAIATGRKPATIRSWAHRGRLKREGTNGAGRALYDLEKALKLADQPGPLCFDCCNPDVVIAYQFPAGFVKYHCGDCRAAQERFAEAFHRMLDDAVGRVQHSDRSRTAMPPG